MKTLDVVAAIIERDGKILLAQRPQHTDQSGMWEFAGGKVESGENQPEALIRELREELGIEAVVGRYIASHQREVSPTDSLTCLACTVISGGTESV